MVLENVIETDVLVVGGGMSGLFAAIKAREEGVNVTLVDRGYVGKTGSVFYAEGFYSVFNPDWGHNLNAWMDQIAKTGDYKKNIPAKPFRTRCKNTGNFNVFVQIHRTPGF